MRKRRFAPVSLAFLAACASGPGDYPSLAIRDAERVTGTMAPAEPEPYVPSATPADVVDLLTRLTAEAAAAHAAFLAKAPEARQAVSTARGAGAGSENWASGQVALAGLESARSQAMVALADLDRLYVEAAVAAGELERIAAAREDVIEMVEAENAVIDELAAVLR